MTKEKSIPVFFLILLLALFSNNNKAFSCASLTHPRNYYSPFHKVNDHETIPVAKQIHNKVWIKVRYKGGESPVFNYTPAFHFIPVVFANCIKAQHYTAFISAQNSFLFKLRGPPVSLS